MARPIFVAYETINGEARMLEHDALKQTDAEIAAGVTPVNYAYVPGDVRRYLTAWNDGSDQTTGLQSAMNVAYATSGELILPSGLNIACSGVSLTMSGNRTNQGFAIVGPGWNGAKITQTGSPTAIITIIGATPTFNPSEAPLVLEGFTIEGVGKTAAGILLDGIALFRVSNVQIRLCNACLHLKSALIGSVNYCMLNEGNYGLLAQRDGALPYPLGGSGCNRVTVSDTVVNLNTTFGIYLESGGNWSLHDVDIEGNGTAGNANTGGIRITATIVDDFGFAVVSCDGLWMESNAGTPFLVDSASGLTLAISNTLMFNVGDGHMEIWILGASRVSIKDTFAPSGGGAVWDITATYLTLNNAQVTTLLDSGVTFPNYVGSSTATAAYVIGREEVATATLTGCTTSPTGNITCTQQGDEITLEIPTISGTSNAITATLTGGIPARYRPAATVFLQAPVTDNGVTDIQLIDVAASGTITLYKAGLSNGLTAAGTKGIAKTVLKFKK